MANHGFISSHRHFKKEQVALDLQEINERRFKGLLKIEDSEWGEDGSWFVSYQDSGWEYPKGFNIWIKSPRMLEHRHTQNWAYYLELSFANELAVKYNGLLGDESDDEKIKPNPEKYSTFKKYLDSRYCDFYKRNPKSCQQILDIEWEYVPEELKDC